MKKALFGIIGILALAFGGSAAQAYPPSEPTLIFSVTIVAPGEDFSLTVEGCVSGEEVVFEVEGSSDTATCETLVAGFAPSQAAAGSATGTLSAPTEPGTYEVTATLTQSGETASGEITVVAEDDGADDGDDGDDADDGAGVPGDDGAGDTAGQLPETGSSATTPVLQIGGILLLVGGGLVGVSYARRNRRTSAA